MNNMTEQRAVIFSGGLLEHWMIGEIRPGDYVIGADRGALFLLRHGVKPDLAIGDFDSVSGEEKTWIREQSAKFEDCDPVMKDVTDTEMAFDRALHASPQRIVIFGGLGRRVDHSLANVHLLKRGADAGIRCEVVDSSNRVTLVTPQLPMRLAKGRYPFVSLLPLSMVVEGITLSGFRYPLIDFRMELGTSRGISNELEAGEGTIRVRSGCLLVMESREPDELSGGG